MRIRTIGHAVFASTLIALGILGATQGDFTVIWAPVPQGVPARHALVYVCVLISIGCGIGLLFRRTATIAARVLLAYLLAWMLAFRLPGLFRSLAVDVYWAACSTAVMVAAAWVLYVWFATDADVRRVGFSTSGTGLRIARTFYGLAMIPFGIAHVQYLQNTESLVPAWLPAHGAWAYLTGAAFIAAGVAILTGVCARLAAVLSAWQMGLFLLLVWIPRVATGSVNAFQWGETVVSWVLTAAAWVVADSYRSPAR